MTYQETEAQFPNFELQDPLSQQLQRLLLGFVFLEQMEEKELQKEKGEKEGNKKKE